MNILAIECATDCASVALQTDSGVSELRSTGEKHASFVLPALDRLLADTGLARSALDAVAVGRGPGGFTGVRFALAVAQGLALGFDRPTLGVSTLAALAWTAVREAGLAAGTDVLALLDARMQEVYAATFRIGADGTLALLGDEAVMAPSAVAAPAAGALTVAGSGLAAYRAAVAAAVGRPFQAMPEVRPSAAAIAALASPELAAGRGLPADALRPVYLRDKVALTEAERRV